MNRHYIFSFQQLAVLILQSSLFVYKVLNITVIRSGNNDNDNNLSPKKREVIKKTLGKTEINE